MAIDAEQSCVKPSIVCIPSGTLVWAPRSTRKGVSPSSSPAILPACTNATPLVFMPVRSTGTVLTSVNVGGGPPTANQPQNPIDWLSQHPGHSGFYLFTTWARFRYPEEAFSDDRDGRLA
jgi:hypothetical protein